MKLFSLRKEKKPGEDFLPLLHTNAFQFRSHTTRDDVFIYFSLFIVTLGRYDVIHSDVLQQATLQLLSCGTGAKILCVNIKGQDTCRGDSGGPLMLTNDSGQKVNKSEIHRFLNVYRHIFHTARLKTIISNCKSINIFQEPIKKTMYFLMQVALRKCSSSISWWASRPEATKCAQPRPACTRTYTNT